MPDSIHPDCKSNAERKLFSRFEQELSGNYIVMHSLGLAKHGRNFSSEIDFLIISYQGMLILEVKGGRVSHERGVWHFTNRFNETDSRRKSPMKQAREAMYALRGNVWNKFGRDSDQGRTIFSDCVLFTDVPFREDSPEWDLKKIYGSDRMRTNLAALVKEMYNYAAEEYERVVGHLPAELSKNHLNELRKYLRRDFDLIPPLSSQINMSYQNMIKLTERQYEVMDMMESDRVVVRGGAGTGKTLLAMQKARKHAGKGEKVIFICYNTLLASSLNKIVHGEGLQNQLTVSTLHAFCLKTIRAAGLRVVIEENTDHFFQKILPEHFPEAFCQVYDHPPFDLMIIDEGQDFKYYRPYVEMVDWIVEGGLEKGRWIWFEDDRQAIFSTHSDGDVFEPEQYGTAKIRLRENCRNTRPIAAFTGLISGVLPEGDLKRKGPEVEEQYYRSTSHQFGVIENMISRLLSDGMNPDEIIILTTKSATRTVLAEHNRIAGHRLAPLDREWFQTSDTIRYTSVWKFKGLESKVIIVTDIDNMLSPEARKLNYVSTSRANAYLGVCIHESCASEFDHMVQELALSFVKKNGV